MSRQRSPKRTRRDVPSTPRGRHAVTVLITSYNYGRFLRGCVDSVLTQRDVDVRVLIIDDCSSDDTPQVTAALTASDPRVTVIRHEINRGHIPSVNEGFATVETEFVVKLDADDLLAPGTLARSLALMEEHPEVTFVYGRPRHFSHTPPSPTDGKTKSWSVWSGRDWVAERCRSGTNVISQPEVMMRVSALRKALPIRAELPHTSDLHLWMQLASLGEVGRVNGPDQGYYRVHSASMQRSVHTGYVFDLTARRNAFDSVFANEAGALPGATELRDTARRTLAADALDLASRAYDRGLPNDEPVDDLVAFAVETSPAARALPEWRALEKRRAVGVKRVRRSPRFIAAAAARRASEELAQRRWQRTGQF